MPLIFVLIPDFTERQEAMRIPVATIVTTALCLMALVVGQIAHPFQHAGWIHVLGTLLFLWLAMSSLENVWSRGVLVGSFLACGAFGGVVQLLFMGDQPLTLSIGASGGVAGLMGAYLVYFARARIRMWFFFWGAVFVRKGTFRVPAWVAPAVWFGYLLFSWLVLGAQDVGYGAHIGGFALGAVGALAFTRTRKAEPQPPPAEQAAQAPAPWEDEPPPAAAPTAETPDELVANIHDWMASSDAAEEQVPPVPWTDDSIPQVPAPPQDDRFTTDESLQVSAPWGRVSDPDEDDPVTARLRPRTSRLAAIETERLSLETAGGAPFKVPFEQVVGVFPAHIGGDDAFDVCDLVQGIHRTAGGVLVETVRMPGPLHRLDEPFAAQVRQLMTALSFVRTWPGGRVGEGSDFPDFDSLDEYERALLRCIAEEG